MRAKSVLWISCLAWMVFMLCGKSGKETTKLFPVQADDKYQYINRDGDIVINPQFSEVSCFRSGIALVKPDGIGTKWGYINEKGEYIIQPAYKYATIFQEGVALVVMENGSPTAIDEKGEIKFTLKDAINVRIFFEDLAAFSQTNSEGKTQWGFVNKKGEIKITPQFSEVGNFSDGFCAVANDNDKYGFIDKSGALVIPHQFDGAYKFINGYAVVKSGEKYGVIDKKGKYKINPNYESLTADGDWYLYVQDNKYGWINMESKIMINPQFDIAYPFNGNELAPASTGSKFGGINKDQKIVINPSFAELMPFDGDMALFKDDNFKIGFIDQKGSYAINPQFKKVSKDYVYLIYNSTYYEAVETDFFDVNAIIARVKKNLTEKSIEGITTPVTAKQILEKFGKTSDQIEKGVKDIIFIEEKISADANLFFGVSFYQAPVYSSGWTWYYNENVMVQNTYYIVKLKNNGKNKSDQVFKAMINAFTGYTKNEQRSTENRFVLDSKNMVLVVINDPENEQIIVGFNPPNRESTDSDVSEEENID